MAKDGPGSLDSRAEAMKADENVVVAEDAAGEGFNERVEVECNLLDRRLLRPWEVT